MGFEIKFIGKLAKIIWVWLEGAPGIAFMKRQAYKNL